MDIIGIKSAPGDHESNFKKKGAIPSERFYPDVYYYYVYPLENTIRYKCQTENLSLTPLMIGFQNWKTH